MNSTQLVRRDDILVVDDSADDRRLLYDRLKAAGFDVRLASDASSALTVVAAKIPDLIILDIRMGGTDAGFDVCDKLKAQEKTRDIPVLFITAHDDEERKVLAFEKGGLDYIAKPFSGREVVERVKTHLKLREAQRRKLERVLLLVGHDVLKDCTNIRFASEILNSKIEQGVSRDELRDAGRTLERDALVHAELVKGLAEWSKRQLQGWENEPKATDVATVVAGQIKVVKRQADLKGIDLRSTIQQHTIAFVDSAALGHILRNLIGNSIKFTPPGGQVDVSVRVEDNGLVILVRDTGVGMCEEETTAIKERRAISKPGTLDERGLGLGLDQCFWLAENIAVAIGVESKLGAGTTFSISIPSTVKEATV
jgi:DNA-binding response OmpR family regulator